MIMERRKTQFLRKSHSGICLQTVSFDLMKSVYLDKDQLLKTMNHDIK